MKSSILQEHLDQAERHVVEGEQVIARQRSIVERLQTAGHDALQARELLRQFEQLQATHVADRDRLRAALKF